MKQVVDAALLFETYRANRHQQRLQSWLDRHGPTAEFLHASFRPARPRSRFEVKKKPSSWLHAIRSRQISSESLPQFAICDLDLNTHLKASRESTPEGESSDSHSKMPEKPLTIATYAAGASLAAITLVYVFGPTFFLDGDVSSAKRSVVGLFNPANDCFINSILQALAGLPDLRKYLIQETHRRRLDGAEVYKIVGQEAASEDATKAWKLEGLRQGIVTKALKDVLDKLNERPIYKKTISAQEFVHSLELAFRTRISRQQQDAQEFLQVVTERLCDEYYAGQKARREFKKSHGQVAGLGIDEKEELVANGDIVVENETSKEVLPRAQKEPSENPEEMFPFEGKFESQIECTICGFKPKPSVSSFVTLTLNVPQKSHTTLNQCFDGMLKVEEIEDFKCDKCRLDHALDWKHHQLGSCSDPLQRQKIELDMEKIQKALREDPERALKDVEFPDPKHAPKRRIKRHMRISSFPKILAIHLSRSIFSASSWSTKNMAKVSFPETLPLGGLLDQKQFKLLGVVTHKGSHNSGHYETFRRQTSIIPFSTPNSFGTDGVYSRQGSPNPSVVQSPRLSAQVFGGSRDSRSQSFVLSPSPDPSSANTQSTSSLSSRSSLSHSSSLPRRPPTSAPRPESPVPSTHIPNNRTSLSRQPTEADVSRFKKRHRRRENRWWRVSDDKVKESKTNEVLGMQKEVYLLFYELDRRVEDERL